MGDMCVSHHNNLRRICVMTQELQDTVSALEAQVERLSSQLQATEHYRKADLAHAIEAVEYRSQKIREIVQTATIALTRKRFSVVEAQLSYIHDGLEKISKRLEV